MRRPFTRAAAISVVGALVLSLSLAPPAGADTVEHAQSEVVANSNNPPERPETSTISDSLGGVCQTDPAQPRLINNTTVTFNAQIRDRDSERIGQQVKSRFEWKIDGADEPLGTGDSVYVTVRAWPDGTYRPVTARGLPEKELIAYRVRGHDRTDWGPWSSWCYIKIDTTKPESAPEVTSTDYPAGDRVQGSVGRSGEFTFSNNGVEAATAYHYSVNDASCSTKITLDEPGASATVTITPVRSGPHVIHARTTDAHGNSSVCESVYRFIVAPLSDPVAYFPLDEGQGTTSTDVMDRSRTATALQDLDWTRGRVGARAGGSYRLEGAAAQIGGNSMLATDGPVVDTSGSFSVSAWVYLDELPTGNATAVAQAGESGSGFHLGYQGDAAQAWTFTMASHDGDPATWTYADATTPVETGVWTHLLGVHDPDSGEIALYVDGVERSRVEHAGAWSAEGELLLGGGKHEGDLTHQWPGAIDDVRVWNRKVFDESFVGGADARSEVWELANRPAALEGRWMLEETEGTIAADASDHGLDATLNADPSTAWGQAWNNAIFAPGVRLDAAEREHLITEGPAIRTDRSYSVAAWVRLDEIDHDSTVLDQGAFSLGYEHAPGGGDWVLKVASEDGTGANEWHRARSSHRAWLGEWTHLTATYDHSLGRVTLYVDGVEQGSVEVSGALHTGDPVTIGGSWSGEELSDPWAGDIGDVHLYQGTLLRSDISRVMLGSLPLS
ncbi:LamG domain-containing protein [Nocardiopsis alba]|uniref:LamG domain-containing protein n=1 Tax=Nocardiopsis alba TaxID=53437 RepID=UPI00366C2507